MRTNPPLFTAGTPAVTPVAMRRNKAESTNKIRLKRGDYSSGERQTTMTKFHQYADPAEFKRTKTNDSVTAVSTISRSSTYDSNHDTLLATEAVVEFGGCNSGDEDDVRFGDDDASVDLCSAARAVEHKHYLKQVDNIRAVGVPAFGSTLTNQAPRSKEKRSEIDPWGWRGEYDDSPLPQGYCVHCRCPEDLCHNTVFGHFCELSSFLFLGDGRRDLVKTTTEEFEADQNRAYNQYLNVKTFEALGILDGYNEYSPPSCLKDGSMARMFNMFLFKRYEQLGRGSVHHA